MIPIRQNIANVPRPDSLVVGVDIGGTNTALGVIDGRGTLLRSTEFPTTSAEGPAKFVRTLANEIQMLLAAPPISGDVRSIGIACPAVNARKGVVENPANLGWGTVDIVKMLQEHYDRPVFLLNDGDAAVLGEVRFGVARGLSNVVLVTLGTGLGGGIVMDGELVRGTNGTGGEIGHIIVAPGGRQCACGRRGCVETYVSATGVCRTAAELMATHLLPSRLRAIPFVEVTALKMYDLARDGDELARLAFEVTGRHLGRLLANLAAIYDPEALVLYGGLVHAGPYLLDPTFQAFHENVLEHYKSSVRILVTRLNDGQASILGAGTHALQMLES